MKKHAKFGLAVFSAILLTSCGIEPGTSLTSNGQTSGSPVTSAVLNTEQTDKLKLTEEWEGKNFINDGIGQVTLNYCTDGDTTSVISGTKKISIRYNGINTPESTSQIEEWGPAASKFNKSKLENAYRIVAQNFVDIWGQKTSSRYLGYIWYQMTPDDDFRLLNLELVEEAYTKNYNFKTEDPYYQYFQDAEANAKATGKRVWGEDDPDVDTSGKATEISIYELKQNWEKYASTAKKLIIHAIIADKIGGQMVLRDVTPHEVIDDEGEILYTAYSGIYSYTVSSGATAWLKIGDEIRLYCKAGEFAGNKQLTDLNLEDSPIMSSEYCRVLSEGNVIDPTVITSADAFENAEGDYIEATVTVTRTFEEAHKYDSYGEYAGDYTVYANLLGTTTNLNIRVDATCNPTYDTDVFVEGNVLKVRGQLTKYYDSYQIAMGNNTDGLQKITVVQ